MDKDALPGADDDCSVSFTAIAVSDGVTEVVPVGLLENDDDGGGLLGREAALQQPAARNKIVPHRSRSFIVSY